MLSNPRTCHMNMDKERLLVKPCAAGECISVRQIGRGTVAVRPSNDWLQRKSRRSLELNAAHALQDDAVYQ